MSTVAGIQENEKVLITGDGIHRDGIGGSVEILFEILGTIEIHIMVANNEEAWLVVDLGVGVVAKCRFSHAESSFPAFVDHVAGMDGKDGVGVVAHRSDVLVESVVLALRDDAVTLGIM